ncbi:uncharacterized protein V6R79_012114 [Siganus canaliculatus]
MSAHQRQGVTFWNSSYVDQFYQEGVPSRKGSFVKKERSTPQRLVVNAKSMASTKGLTPAAPRRQYGHGSHNSGHTAPRSQVKNRKVSEKPAAKKDTDKPAKPVDQRVIQLAPPPKVNPWGTSVKIPSTTTRCQELDVAEFPLFKTTKAKLSPPIRKVVKVDGTQGADPEPLRESAQTPDFELLKRSFDLLTADMLKTDVLMMDMVNIDMLMTYVDKADMLKTDTLMTDVDMVDVSQVDVDMADVDMVDVDMVDVSHVDVDMVDVNQVDVDMADVDMVDADEEKPVLAAPSQESVDAQPESVTDVSDKPAEPVKQEIIQLEVEVHSDQGPEPKPAEKSSVEPEDKSSLVEPAEDSSAVKPAEESSLVEPAEESSPVEPAEESSPVEPAEESSLVEPAEESSLVEPAEESSVVKPAEESSLVEPAEESSQVDPAEESSLVDPAEESSVVEPAEESSAVKPAEESSLVESAEESSLVKPEQEAEPKPVCKSPEKSATESKTNKNKKNKTKKQGKKDGGGKVNQEKKQNLEAQQKENMQQEAESVHPSSHEEEAQDPSTKKKKLSFRKRFCRFFLCCFRPQTEP